MSRISVLVKPDRVNRILDPEALKLLQQLGEMKMWDGETNPRDFSASSHAILTSWGSPKIDLSFLEISPELGFISHAAGSIKPYVDVELLKRGVRVSSASNILGRNVAITTLGLILTSLKRVWQWDKYLRKGDTWRDNQELVELTDELAGKTVGVIAASQVGRNLIGFLKIVTTKILVYDPYMDEEKVKQLGGQKVDSLLELASRCDIIALCAPLTQETRGMLNEEFFQAMKDRAIFVNTARGAILDENALIGELRKKRLFACLDVTEPEPPFPDSPLRKLENVLLTPHIAGCVNSGLKEVGRFAVQEIARFIKNEPLVNEIKWQVLDILG
jgi:phosphoglycerate dehydrogenase-like enzyme